MTVASRFRGRTRDGDEGLLVVGSGPAGVSAAEAFRDGNPSARVRIVTADPDLPYARPPLSKAYLRGTSDDVDLHPREWFGDRRIELVQAEVTALDVHDRCVIAGGEALGYSELVLACGAEPAALPVPGGEQALPLRSLSDARRLRQAANGTRSAVVIGAGFIGCEAAASLATLGIAVTLVAPDSVPQEKRLGSAAGERLLRLVAAAGVRYMGGASVTSLENDALNHVIHLANGDTLEAGLVLAATGVHPRAGFAIAAGLASDRSRIVAGADLRTSAEHVYAAGDVALAFNTTAARHLAVEHWQDALDQGAIAGAQAAGRPTIWYGVPGFWTTIGDATVKYHAWGDGYQNTRVNDHAAGFTIWYETNGATVGVLTHNADDDYELGETLIEQRRPPPS